MRVSRGYLVRSKGQHATAMAASCPVAAAPVSWGQSSCCYNCCCCVAGTGLELPCALYPRKNGARPLSNSKQQMGAEAPGIRGGRVCRHCQVGTGGGGAGIMGGKQQGF